MQGILKPIKEIVTVVTGGASGLGKGTVEWLHRNGSKIAILDIPQSEGAKVAKEMGNGVLFAPTDVTSQEQVNEAMKLVKKEFGRLDALVNCAGISYSFKLYAASRREKGPLDRFQRTMNVNVIGMANVITEALDVMIDNDQDEWGQRGVIINTSSIAAFDGQAGQASYAASKGAVASMTLPLARDFSNSGIRVMCIAPGVFDTPLVHGLHPKVVKFLENGVPFPSRFGKPAEFAALVEHIIQNPYLNGEVIRIDGSYRMPP
ncbi:short chain dehydrogenase domain-containing protein [Ditylenchus destructor]|uniref:3-hydroxyacyl-CoA dehydrogenase type-2 n=1 Tax=Ditylenchus destructor TaxID=166010 RepID=A0AAD4NJ77_9BILA|nr:short chain dehydrogenase domain-containing protein [Ditylenchus destructor]